MAEISIRAVHFSSYGNSAFALKFEKVVHILKKPVPTMSLSWLSALSYYHAEVSSISIPSSNELDGRAKVLLQVNSESVLGVWLQFRGNTGESTFLCKFVTYMGPCNKDDKTISIMALRVGP